MDIETYSKQLFYFFITDKNKFRDKLSTDKEFFKRVCRIKHLSFQYDKSEVQKADHSVQNHLIDTHLDFLSVLFNTACESYGLENLLMEKGRRKEKTLNEVIQSDKNKWLDYRSVLFNDIDFLENSIDEILEEFELSVDYYNNEGSNIFRRPEKSSISKEEYNNAEDWQKLFIDDKFLHIKVSIEILINEINRHLGIIFKYLELSYNKESKEKAISVLNNGLEELINLSANLKERIPEIDHFKALHEYFIERKHELLNDDFQAKGSTVIIDSDNEVKFNSFFKNIDDYIIKKLEKEFVTTLKGQEIAAFMSICKDKNILDIVKDSKNNKSRSAFIRCFKLNNSETSVTNLIEPDFKFSGYKDVKERIEERFDNIYSPDNTIK